MDDSDDSDSDSDSDWDDSDSDSNDDEQEQRQQVGQAVQVGSVQAESSKVKDVEEPKRTKQQQGRKK